MSLPKTPLLTVDAVVLDAGHRLLAIRRKHPPFQSAYALPGGFVEIGETVEQACRRELSEETGVTAGRLELIGVYSDPERDPRGHTCSIAFLTRVRSSRARAGDDAQAVCWLTSWRGVEFAFDHRRIVEDAMRLARRRRPAAGNRRAQR
jgi:8-oxo-dGTP diphosphatase